MIYISVKFSLSICCQEIAFCLVGHFILSHSVLCKNFENWLIKYFMTKTRLLTFLTHNVAALSLCTLTQQCAFWG